MSEPSKAVRALEARKDMGVLEVAREHLVSENVSGLGIRPTDEMVGHEVDGESFNQLLDFYSVKGIQELKRRKKESFEEIVESLDTGEYPELDEDQEENLRLAVEEYERGVGVPDEVTELVDGENGLREKWGDAEDFSEVEEDFIDMVYAFRDFSGGDYSKVLAIWEPNVKKIEVETILDQLTSEAKDILSETGIERIEEVWHQIDDEVDSDRTLAELTKNPAGMHEFLANYILGGNPVRMPVRIAGSGMEYGNAVMAPLQTVDNRFWAKCFDTTAHEFGHTLGRERLSSEHAFLPLGEPPSEAADEGTARFYQNQVFRSEEFLSEFFGPSIREWFDTDDDFDGRDIYRWFNAVDPSNRERISADPITYPLHIAVRYDLEKELIESDEPVEDIVEDIDDRWHAKMQEYLGDPLGMEIERMPDSETVLQDVHWGKGKLGYFPTYTLGDVMAANWRQALDESLEHDLETYLADADMEPINEWIVENVWRHGKAFWERSDYTELDPEPYISKMREVAEMYE